MRQSAEPGIASLAAWIFFNSMDLTCNGVPSLNWSVLGVTVSQNVVLRLEAALRKWNHRVDKSR
jgi:hypothetical protein